jgi:hypothetical protein
MLLFKEAKDASAPQPTAMAEMKKYSAELASQGVFRCGAPLAQASAGASVRVRGGNAFVSDGPFAETKEVVAGFWIVAVADRDEALAIARRCPHARHAPVEVHAMRKRFAFPDSKRGTPFLLAFRREPGVSDPDGAKYREMIAFAEELAREGTLFDIAPLASDPAPARIETRGAKTLVTDGPFAESKEGIGGYALVRAAGGEEGIEIAKRFPHARWGPVEVREILFFDPV